MIKVKIPRETWHKAWKSLLQEGPVTRVSEEKQLPFEEIDAVVSPSEKIRHLLASPLQ